MKTTDAVELAGERLRRIETAEPRPTLWEVWFTNGAITALALIGSIKTPHRIYNKTGRSLTLVRVFASLGVAPTLQKVILDANMNGATIFAAPGDRPTIAIGAFTANVPVTGTVLWPDGSYLTVDIDQVDFAGFPGAAADLTVQIVHHA